MYHVKTSYKSLADYDLEMILQQRKNMAKVESVLSLYDKNNQHLFDQVNSLMRQNQSLRSQIRNTSPKRLKQSSFTHKSSISQVNSYLETDKQTVKKQKNLRNLNKFSHPRNVYMDPIQVQILNRKMLQQAKNQQKKYDVSRGYENFKQKLNERKEQLKKSYKSKSIMNNEQNFITKSPQVSFADHNTFQIQKRQPLNEISRQNFNVYQQKINKTAEKRQTSPYQILQKSTFYHSPQKIELTAHYKKQDTQRSSSAIKVQNSCPSVSIRIAEPKTKWGDLSSTYFEKSARKKEIITQRIKKDKNQESSIGQKSRGQKRKKFLQVISQSVDVRQSKKVQL